MSAWGNISNDTGGLSYNIAASLSDNQPALNPPVLSADQFPVLGQSSVQANSDQPQRQASAAAAAASILLNTLQQNGNTTVTSSNGTSSNPNAGEASNQIQNSNSLKGFSAANILPPGLETQQQQPDSIQHISNQFGGIDISKPEIIPEEEKSDMDKYGLNGLLDLLRNETSEQYALAMGTDLNMLGLDMSAAKADTKISKTFASPWLETSRSEVISAFKKPDSFNIGSQELGNLESMLPSFTDENLFFIFYSKPKDILQDLVSKELNNRSWRFHKDLQVWVTKDNTSDASVPVQGGEQRSFIFFDPTSWEYVTKEFLLYYNSLL